MIASPQARDTGAYGSSSSTPPDAIVIIRFGSEKGLPRGQPLGPEGTSTFSLTQSSESRVTSQYAGGQWSSVGKRYGMSVTAAASSTRAPQAMRTPDSEGDVDMRDAAADSAIPKVSPPSNPQTARAALPPPTPTTANSSIQRQSAGLPTLAPSRIAVGEGAAKPPGPLQLCTLAQLDAQVASAAQTLTFKFDGANALYVDPFENRQVRVSLHANQRRWRAKRITRNGRALLAKESRLRALGDALRRHSNEEVAAVAAVEAIRLARQKTDEKVKELARDHAGIARTTGSLKLVSMIDARYAQHQEAQAADRARKRARLQELSDDYRAKRKRLTTAGHSQPPDPQTASGATSSPPEQRMPPNAASK